METAEENLQKNIFYIIEKCNQNSDHILKDFNLSKNSIMQIPCEVLIIYRFFII